MRKPRLLLSFVLVLLVINAAFFIGWYGLDLQRKVSNIIEKQVGAILGGKLQIGSLSIGDRLIVARDISFDEDEGVYAFTAKELRVRYNLLKLIVHRGDLAQGISKIDITRPYFEYHYTPSDEPSRDSDAGIPDLTKYFGALSIIDASALITVTLATSETDTLQIRETINNLNATLQNTSKSEIALRCNIGSAGILNAKATLDRGAIANLEAELRGFEPSHITHPQATNLHSEISVTANIVQPNVNAPMQINYSALIWNTQATVMEHRLKIPFINAKGDLSQVKVEVSSIDVGQSSMSAQLLIEDLDSKPRFESSIQLAALDLSLIDQSLSGLVRGTLEASGTLDEPVAKARLRAESVQYDTLAVSDIELVAGYVDKQLTVHLEQAIWEDQLIEITALLDTYMMDLSGALSIRPLDQLRKDVRVEAEINFELGLYSQYPNADLQIEHLNVIFHDIESGDIQGSIVLAPLVLEGITQNYLAEVKLQSDKGLAIDAIGDILNKSISLELDMMDLELASVVSHELTEHHKPVLGGKVLVIMSDDKVFGSIALSLVTESELAIDTEFKSHFSFDFADMSGALNYNSLRSSFNDNPADISFYATYKDGTVTLANFDLNNVLILSGMLNTKDPSDFNFNVMLREISSTYIQKYLDFLEIKLPEFESISLSTLYNIQQNQELAGSIQLQNLYLEGLNPLSATLGFGGDVKELTLEGEVRDRFKRLSSIDGKGSVLPTVDVDLSATTTGLSIKDLLPDLPLAVNLDSKIDFRYKDIFGEDGGEMSLATAINATNFTYQNIKLDTLRLAISQTPERLILDELNVHARDVGSIRGSGALDYNYITNTFYDGDSELVLDADLDVMRWLKENVDAVEDARGRLQLNCSIGTFEDEFFIREGELSLLGSNLKIKDQMETVSDIRFRGEFENNRFTIREGLFNIGQGRLQIRNYFDPEPSDHFMVGVLDLGIFEIRTGSNGIMFNLPDFTLQRALSRAVISGRNSDYLVVKGPFDAMKIKGDVLVSNARLVYPPNTDNLLKLINSVRESATSRPASDPVPLPFILDLMVLVGDNNSYETYPLNVQLSSSSFLHLLYDGSDFTVNEANFVIERGTIDFVGTIFQVDFVSVNIIDAQNIMNIGGTFYRRAADGTMITLRISTPYDPDKDLISRLEFDLSSDNPEDRTITHIIARLRYNESVDELTPEQRQSLLQDDAVMLISQNLNTTILTPFFHPIENSIRRFLRLDSFNIRAGFIENLVSEYASDPSQLSAYTDLNQMDTEIKKLSSSILLNNLSVSMSKYLGRKFFLDYEFSLEEATNISEETRILVSHDTSLRMLLPWRLRIAYTLKYEAAKETFSHGVMIQRSFRF